MLKYTIKRYLPILFLLSGCAGNCDLGILGDEDACERKKLKAFPAATVSSPPTVPSPQKSARELEQEEERRRIRNQIIKDTHSAPVGGVYDVYHPAAEGVIACAMPGSVLGIVAQIRAKGRKHTWELQDISDFSPETTSYKLGDMGCLTVPVDSYWKILWSDELDHYMIETGVAAPVRMYFYYGEMLNARGEVPPAGRPGSQYSN